MEALNSLVLITARLKDRPVITNMNSSRATLWKPVMSYAHTSGEDPRKEYEVFSLCVT